MLTEQQKAEIHSALQSSNGDRASAAQTLGMDLALLTKLIHNTRELRERWSAKKSTPSVNVETLAVVPAETRAVERENSALNKPTLRQGLASLGIEGSLVELAHSFAQFQGNHYRSVLGIMGGGLVRRYLKMEELIDGIDGEIAGLSDTPEDIAREDSLRRDRAALIELQQKCYDRIVKAQLTLALAREKEGGGNGKGKGKPGFRAKGERPTTLVNAQPGSTVNLGQ